MTPPSDLLLQQLKKDVHAALKNWHTVDDSPENLLTDLLLVQNKQRELHHQTPAARRLSTNQVLHDGLEQLARQQPQAADLLKKRFHDQQTILNVSHQLSFSVDQVKHKQREALSQLTTILCELEMEAREAYMIRQESQLEAKSYTQLFGISSLSDRLLSLLTPDASPWVITLVGIGGIGKTSLANYTVRRVIRRLHYEEIIWLKIVRSTKRSHPLTGPEQTFQQLISQLSKKLLPALPSDMLHSSRLQQLQQLLKNQRYLIVVDNLELKEDTTYLLSELVTLAMPSRFLLTSRTAPANHAGSLAIILSELSEADSITLMRHYAEEIGFLQASTAPYEDLLPIYEVVGGNPFALKQLINLAKVRPLPALLASIRERPLQAGEAIYQHILRETWHTLNDEAKAVLAIMPLAANGGMDPEQIMALSGLSQAQLWPAIDELLGRSLLEMRSSSIWERFYGIHRLTELFIRSLLNNDDL
ncbi:MAG: hypothetical protein DHS20C20_22470 [Ardenticatenaceae bacterium]|nr:MAG: hypothetical protein DHS20C20_22470 [Ardenticatenaceae bacterium]